MYLKQDCVFLSAHSQFGRIFSLELQIAIKRVQRIYERSCCMVVLYGYCFWTKKFYQILMDIEKDKEPFLRPEDINVLRLRVLKQVLKFPSCYNELVCVSNLIIHYIIQIFLLNFWYGFENSHCQIISHVSYITR